MIEIKETNPVIMQINAKNITTETEAPPATDISLGLSNAAVGDIIKVKAVDDNGTPTAWESAAMPDNQENWVLLGEYDLSLEENQVSRFVINKYNNKDFTVKKAFVQVRNVKTDGARYINANGIQIGSSNQNATPYIWAYLIPVANGVLNIGSSSNEYWTAITDKTIYSSNDTLQTNNLTISLNTGNFTAGSIKIWAVIKQ